MARTGFVIGLDPAPLTVNTYRGAPMVFTVQIQTPWLVAPFLYFPDYDVEWESELVEDQPSAARWEITAEQVDDIPDLAVAELKWEDRVLARGLVRRRGN